MIRSHIAVYNSKRNLASNVCKHAFTDYFNTPFNKRQKESMKNKWTIGETLKCVIKYSLELSESELKDIFLGHFFLFLVLRDGLGSAFSHLTHYVLAYIIHQRCGFSI